MEKKTYLVSQEYSLLPFLSVGTCELRLEDREFEVDESFSLYKLTPSDVVPLEELYCKPLGEVCEKSASYSWAEQ